MRTHLCTPLAALATVCAALMLSGCASPCARVKQRQDEILGQHADAAPGSPHLVASVPFSTMGWMLSQPVQKIRPITLPLPDVDLPQLPGLKLGLGSVAVGVERVTVQPAPDGQLGLQIALGLLSGGKPVTSILLDARVTPQIDPGAGTIVLALSPRDIASLRPTMPPGQRSRLIDFLWSRVPASVHRLVSRGRVEQLAGTLIDDLLGRSFETIRANLLTGAERLVQFEITVPPLPIRQIQLRSEGDARTGALEIAIFTALAAPGVSSGPARASAIPLAQGPVQLRMSGGAAAALANHAMASGQLPARYGEDGSPDPQGPFSVALAWEAGGPRPLKVHAFKTTGDCVYLQLGGTPKITAASGQLSVTVDDAALERSDGPARIRAGIWLSGIGRETFEFTEQTAARFAIELPGAPLQASASAAVFDREDLVLGLNLAPARPPARSRG
ncbi:MAG: hypothetical protein H6713_07385 [Myxococcales bacterium]|nr:hypothetical protein [Myxococcales bacterium]MCB9749813.1 hypothetical protein [Myxococcales bacterium]